jgi:hypothetical protein
VKTEDEEEDEGAVNDAIQEECEDEHLIGEI